MSLDAGIRWLFGCMGWEKSRPLSACIYHMFREKYTVGTAKGYNDAIKRN